MNFAFRDKKLQTLFITGTGKIARQHPVEIIEKFFSVMELITAITNTEQLKQFSGLRFAALKGDRKGQHSLRLNDQFRLIVEATVDSDGQLLLIIEIADYH